MKKVLVTDLVDPLLIDGLIDLGFQVDYNSTISLTQVHDIISNYSGIIINSKIKMDKSLIDKSNQLEFIGRLGSGMEIIDQPYARSKGIHVYNSPRGNCNAVGEHALGMLLALANKLLMGDRRVRNKIWAREENRGFELKGKTIGLIGFGHTGSSFAQKLTGMEMNVLAFDKYKEHYTDDWRFVHEVSLAELIAQSDIISFHLPLTAETKHYADENFLEQCKDGVILINTSRGQVIETEVLINGLSTKKIGGLCLDVFENEKVKTFTAEEHLLYERLYMFDNTVLTPHVAGWTVESKRHLAGILLEKIRQNA